MEDEVVRVGSKLRVRWMVVSGFSNGGGMVWEGREKRGSGFVCGFDRVNDQGVGLGFGGLEKDGLG